MDNSLNLLNECNIMLTTKDPHIMTCIEYFIDTDEEFSQPMVVIYEKAEYDLSNFLKTQSRPISEQ